MIQVGLGRSVDSVMMFRSRTTTRREITMPENVFAPVTPAEMLKDEFRGAYRHVPEPAVSAVSTSG